MTKSFRLTFHFHLKDKDALKGWIGACESLRLAD
jgi:hypothetical protein